MKKKNIYQLIKLISENKSDAEFNKSQLKSEISELIANKKDITALLDILFPNQIPINIQFFKKLSAIQINLGFTEEASDLVALLMIEAYKKLPIKDSQKLLQLLTEDKEVHFNPILNSLSKSISEIEISPDFAAVLFQEFIKKIGVNVAGRFYKGIENYTYSFPESGKKVLENYIELGLDEIRLEIAWIILGSLRVAVNDGKFAEIQLREIDNKIESSPKVGHRICYNRSWVIPFWQNQVSIPKIKSLLEAMLTGDEKDVIEAYALLSLCFGGNTNNKEYIEFCIEWLKENVSSNMPHDAKLNVAILINNMCDICKTSKAIVNRKDSNSILLKIQPLASDDDGIWLQIENYLVSRLNASEDEFLIFVKQLVQLNPFALINRFYYNNLKQLTYYLKKLKKNALVAELFFSADEQERKLGFCLFQCLEIKNFPKERLKKIDKYHLRLILLTYRQHPFSGEKTSQFFIALEPRFRNASKALKEEFKQEMLKQAINYPGYCLDEWKKVPRKSKFLKTVIDDAENYFEKLKITLETPATSFMFPALIEASKTWKKKSSREISAGVDENSLMMQFARKTDVIYGEYWAVMTEGVIGEPSRPQSFSTKVEYPRLEGIDPEGCQIDRVKSNIQLNELKNECDATE